MEPYPTIVWNLEPLTVRVVEGISNLAILPLSTGDVPDMSSGQSWVPRVT